MMKDPGMSDAELMATSLGLLRAHLAGDKPENEEAVNSMIDAVPDPRVLLAVTVGFLVNELTEALPGGAAELDARLARLQEEYRDSL